VFPGDREGKASAQFAFQLFHKLVVFFTHFIDLHSASKGRGDSFYIRADMSEEPESKVHAQTAQMARIFSPDNIVDTKGGEIMRRYAMLQGIPSICVELGDPSRFQPYFYVGAEIGLRNVARHLNMIPEKMHSIVNRGEIIMTQNSKWTYVLDPGLLLVYPDVSDTVKKGELIGQVLDLFGNVVSNYHAQTDGVVIGKALDPVVRPGDRFIHIGHIPANKVGVRRKHLQNSKKYSYLEWKQMETQDSFRRKRIQNLVSDLREHRANNLFLKKCIVALSCACVALADALSKRPRKQDSSTKK
jgi:predicted deacylase